MQASDESVHYRVTTVAGDGTGADAQFNNPDAIATATEGNLYAVDAGKISGFADGYGNKAQFNSPVGLTTDESGNIFVADMGNNRIRKDQ